MSNSPSLGSFVRRIRKERQWTLAKMSEACGIPLSTLAKIENDKLTLTYDKLQRFSASLGVSLGALFADPQRGDGLVTARRSVAKLENAIRVATPNYIYNYLCSDLRKRRMIPIHVEITAKTLADFGDLVQHDGEEFAFVLEGAVVFHSEYYAPSIIRKNEGIYIDSNMQHGYLVAEGHDRAVILSVCASDDENFEQQLIAEAEGRAGGTEEPLQVPRKHSSPARQPTKSVKAGRRTISSD